MGQTNIKSRVHAIIMGKLNVDAKELTPEANLSNDLGADSLDIAELIIEFEKEFNIAITDSDAEKLNTVGEAIDYIEQNAK
ncbi:MAG: acyl carrier protein [bacterium]